MLFNSLEFLIFLPIVVLIYFVVPKKIKNLWLLAASYYFYMCWNAKYILLILFSTVVTYLSGLVLERIKHDYKDDKRKKTFMNLTVAASFVMNIGLLGYFKYTNFFLGIIGRAFAAVHIQLNIPTFDILLPVGISFFTFQALSYTMDVYRDDIYAEKDFFKYALFVSFFPQLVAGPIERSKNLLKQLNAEHKFEYENLRKGFLLMLWGYFIKIVIADRAAPFVDTIFGDIETYGGWYLVVGIAIFSVQIYCDFYGYSIIAKGAAKILGIDLMENFNCPFLSESVSELWRGWHISLSTWFRDYLYFPLGGGRKGKLRKYINIIIVFVASGLWHGASLSYVVWGGMQGVFQVVGDILEPARAKICQLLQIDRKSIVHRILRIIGTFILFNFSLVFFRSDSATMGARAIKSIAMADNFNVLFDGSLYECGIDSKSFTFLLLCIAILLLADIAKKNNIVISDIILRQHMIYRCAILAVVIVFILTFGIWGPAYDSAGFIYFQF